MPAPPPSAYGISASGAPAAPTQQQHPYAPPPSAPPQAPPAPSHFADYAVAPAAQPFAGPTTAYGTPVWSTAPPKKGGTPLWVKVTGGVFAALIGGGVLLHLYDVATVHHVTTLPATLGTATQDTSPAAQSAISTAIAQAQQSGTLSRVKNFQAGVYVDGSTVVVADMGNIPSNSPAFRASIVNSFSTNETGMTFASVSPGKQGGTESCGVRPGTTMCIWVDDGTVGAVVAINTTDVATAQAYLQSLRDQAEH
jgi:hypothetical protein